MAIPTVGPVPTKLSFAKIAAMPAPNIQPALPTQHTDTKKKPAAGVQTEIDYGNKRGSDIDQLGAVSSADVEVVQNAMRQMGIVGNGPDVGLLLQDGGNGEPLEDEQSNISTSSLKQQSFDTKSIASVTTFAMDEKESIRPDDSASVRAVEDEDPNPGISCPSSFQHEIEPLVPGQRGSSRIPASGVSMVARRYPGLVLANPPRFGDLPISPVSDTRTQEIEVSDSAASASRSDVVVMPPHVPTPDEKLIEALASPKDRLPLLQLEERLVTFITYGRDNMLELPPQNSFTRLLTHKLADYYGMQHQVTEDNSSVRIFRNAPTTLPISLADIAKSIHSGPQSISTAAQVKIMRRVQLGRQMSAGNSTAASSSVPSKATSENGGDINSEEGLQSPYEGTPGREKLKSREEREAQYKAVRDRIFGDFQEPVASENGSTGETSASMSRSSSTSGGKKKSRKSKTPKDDSFTRRSEFFAYGPMQMQQHVPTTFTDSRYQDSYQSHQLPGYPPQIYGQSQTNQFAQYDQSLAYSGINAYTNGGDQMYQGTEGWNQIQHPPPGPVFNMQSMQPFTHHTQMQSPQKDQYTQSMQTTSPSAGWVQTQFANPYQQGSLATGNNAHWQNYNPHVSMQAPEQQFMPNTRQMYANDSMYSGQQPVLPIFTGARSLFNPQTRSFVPNHTSGRGGNRHGRKKGAQSDLVTKSKDISASASPVQVTQGDNNPHKHREDSLQQKYGTPANLPKKPPPSQFLPHFAVDVSASPTPASAGATGNGAHINVNKKTANDV